MNNETRTLGEGEGLTLDERRVLEAYRVMSPQQRKKLQRLCTRLMNDDPKARRLLAMFDAGQLSAEQFLSMM